MDEFLPSNCTRSFSLSSPLLGDRLINSLSSDFVLVGYALEASSLGRLQSGTDHNFGDDANRFLPTKASTITEAHVILTLVPLLSMLKDQKWSKAVCLKFFTVGVL